MFNSLSGFNQLQLSAVVMGIFSGGGFYFVIGVTIFVPLVAYLASRLIGFAMRSMPSKSALQIGGVKGGMRGATQVIQVDDDDDDESGSDSREFYEI